MSWKAKAAALLVLVATYIGSFFDILAAELGLLLLVLAALVAWRYMDGFWRIVGAGLAGGAIAGLLILGPGFRLAMRAVAIMDPIHPEEFTLGGTAFIVIGIGGIMGGAQGIAAHLARRAFAIGSPVIGGVLLAAVVMTLLTFFSGDLSRELFELGISPWVNIPLFGTFAVGYGIATMAVADVVEAKLVARRRTEHEKVPA